MRVGLDFRIDFGAQTETDMKRIACLLALLVVGTLSSTTMAASSPTSRTATVGGGVKHPWTSPYMLAIVTIPEPTTVAVLGLGAAALVVRRRN